MKIVKEAKVAGAPVSTGTTGRETPAGVFAIIEKDKDHHSTLYDDAWMPNMQRRAVSLSNCCFRSGRPLVIVMSGTAPQTHSRTPV